MYGPPADEIIYPEFLFELLSTCTWRIQDDGDSHGGEVKLGTAPPQQQLDNDLNMVIYSP